MTDPDSSNPKKPRKVRRDKGQTLLTQRDLAVLNWIGEQYSARLDQVQRLLGKQALRETQVEGQVSPGTAKRVVNRWERAGWVQSQRFLYAQPSWVWLTKAGLAQLKLPYRAWKPSVGALEHHYQVNQVRLFVEELLGSEARWLGERHLRREQPQAWHHADAQVEFEGLVGIEVELSRKKPETLAVILAQLSHDYDAVLYFTYPAIRPLVENALQGLALDQQKKFKIYTLEEM